MKIFLFEAAIMPFLLDDIEKLTDEEIDEAIKRWIGFSLKNGVCAVLTPVSRRGTGFLSGFIRIYGIWKGRGSFRSI